MGDWWKRMNLNEINKIIIRVYVWIANQLEHNVTLRAVGGFWKWSQDYFTHRLHTAMFRCTLQICLKYTETLPDVACVWNLLRSSQDHFQNPSTARKEVIPNEMISTERKTKNKNWNSDSIKTSTYFRYRYDLFITFSLALRNPQPTNLAAKFGNCSLLHVQAEIDVEFIPSSDPIVEVC